jgi:hypothetical protein
MYGLCQPNSEGDATEPREVLTEEEIAALLAFFQSGSGVQDDLKQASSA